MADRREDNVEFVTRLMEFSTQGPLGQLFVLNSIREMARNVTSISLPEYCQQFQGAPFINPASWYATAQEVLNEFDRREADFIKTYGR